MLTIHASFGLYRAGEVTPLGDRLVRACSAVLVGGLIAFATFQLFPNSGQHQNALGAALLLAVTASLGLQLASRAAAALDVRSQRILVLGTGPDALRVDNLLASHANRRSRLVGFYSVDAEAPAVPAARVLSRDVPLEQAVRDLNVTHVVVAVREQRGGGLPVSQLLSCRLQGVQVIDVPGLFESMAGQMPLDALKASWLIYGDGFRQGFWRRTIKRGFDLVASTVLLLLCAPIALLAALAIFLESTGAVVYTQKRVGLAGRSFRIFKFRTMRSDAEALGPQWASAGDPRITRVGRFLRRTRIDELPQLINVLKGEMSLVGPRPERPEFVEQLTQAIPFYGARHTVKPGITGWAQVRYSYSATVEGAAEKLQYDLYYVKNHTLFLDLVILFETARVVLSGHGAH
jgi:sugar transferase (PEP-CTERM system associated)